MNKSLFRGASMDEWVMFHVKQWERRVGDALLIVPRETSVLDETPKTELNGRGSTRCRKFASWEEAHGRRQRNEDFRRRKSERRRG